MAEPRTESEAPPRGISVEVLVAAACFCVSAGFVGLAGRAAQHPPAMALLLGWPGFALVGGVLLDQRPGARPGRVLTALSLMPVLDIAWVAVRFADINSSPDLVRAVSELAALQVVAVAVAVPWSFREPIGPRWCRAGLLAMAGIGALSVLAAEVGVVVTQVRWVGWAAVVTGCAGIWVLIALGARTDDRTTRRKVAWLLVSLATLGVVVAAVAPSTPAGFGYFLVGSALGLAAPTAGRLWFGSGYRPLDEHLLDLVLVVAVVAGAGLVALLVRLGAGWTRLPSANTSALFACLVTAAMAAPAAVWARRALLARRYGSGLLSPADVALITADLHAKTEPRDLLDKAARMIASASGSRQARIVLGEEAPVVPGGWVLHPLDVGGDRVGALVVETGDPEGPELRQQRIIAQLLPTVALVARAVALAVEAEHARRDVARERDAERKRVMGDLHDGLGPVLAGMSMRVQATLRTAPPSPYAGLLSDLAADLATSRTDLRRIVAGITPSTLEDGDLETALDRLVTSFQGVTGGPRLSLGMRLDDVVSTPVQVAVYRSVAEGVTNALRHAQASAIDVLVRTGPGVVLVDVVDDGGGGQVVPGVGLSSLEQRARLLGGCLEVAAADPRGTRLHVELPARPEVRA